jgi:hypothetical protein
MSRRETSPAEAPPVVAEKLSFGERLRRFFSRNEFCFQFWPGLSSPIERNTMGLWLAAGPLLLILLIKAFIGYPTGFMGFLSVVVLVLGFALMGAGMMEWGTSQEESMNVNAVVFFATGATIVLGVMILFLIYKAYVRDTVVVQQQGPAPATSSPKT